jgi:tetratricopeptide (TPR) repeat protein
MEILTDKLFKLYPSSSFGHFARGKFLLEQGLRMNDGFEFLRTGLESKVKNGYAWTILVEGKIRFGDWDGALEASHTAIRLLEEEKEPSEGLINSLRKCQVRACIELGDVEKAKEALDKWRKGFDDESDEDWRILEGRLALEQLDLSSLKKLQLEEGSKWGVRFLRAVAGLEKLEEGNGTEEVKVALQALLELEEKAGVEEMLDVGKLMMKLEVYDYAAELFFKVRLLFSQRYSFLSSPLAPTDL